MCKFRFRLVHWIDPRSIEHNYALLTNVITYCQGRHYYRLYRLLKQELSSSWDGRAFARNRHGPKSWGCCAPIGELGSHLTQCRLGRGLPPYPVAFRSIQPFGHNRHGPKIKGALVSLFGREKLGPHLTQCRLTEAKGCRQAFIHKTRPMSILAKRLDGSRCHLALQW